MNFFLLKHVDLGCKRNHILFQLISIHQLHQNNQQRPINNWKSYILSTQQSNRKHDIHQFTECQNIDDIMNILWKTDLEYLNNTIYQNGIKQCNNLGDFKGALRVFHLMDKNGIIPTSDSYNILIKCLCDNDRTELAFKYLEIMEQQNKINFDQSDIINTLTLILSSCKNRTSNTEIAENVWQKMIFHYNIIPSIEICNLMISIYSKSGQIDKAEIIWNHLINHSLTKINGETCAEMIRCYSNQKDKYKLIKLQQFMQNNGIKLNAVHYHGLIKYYYNVGNLQQILKLFDEMTANLLPMNEDLLYQLCATYLRLNKPDIIIKELTEKYPKLFEKNMELNGLLFEAQIMKNNNNDSNIKEIITIFTRMINENCLSGYWTKIFDQDSDKFVWWIDLHGIYRRKRMIKFILKYIFQYERYYIEKELNDKRNIIILCGDGVHSDAKYSGNAKTLIQQELLSWNPSIRSKVYDQNSACLVLNSSDIINFMKLSERKKLYNVL